MTNIPITVYNSISLLGGNVPKQVVAEIDDILAFGIEGAKWTPQYVANRWDGRKHMFSKRTKTFPTGFLTDVIKRIHKLGYSPVISYKMSPRDMQEVLPLRLVPWKHQTKLLKAIANKYRGLIQASTGSGKSLVEAGVCGMLNVPTVILTYRKELMYQLRESFEKYLNTDIGIFGDGQWDHKKINVCMVQSLIQLLDVNYSRLLMEYTTKDVKTKKLIDKNKSELHRKLIHETQAVILDECIPASEYIMTNLKNIKIEELYTRWSQGERLIVKSFNTKTKLFEYKAITKMWKRPYKPYIKIAYGRHGRILKCTPDHKILTTTGWRAAKTLTKQDVLIGCAADNSEADLMYYGKKYQLFLGSYLSADAVSLGTILHKCIKFKNNNIDEDYAKFKADILNCTIFLNHSEAGYTFDLRKCSSQLQKLSTTEAISAINIVGLAILILDTGKVVNDNLEVEINRELSTGDISKLKAKLKRIFKTKTKLIKNYNSMFFRYKIVFEDAKSIQKEIEDYMPGYIKYTFDIKTTKFTWEDPTESKYTYNVIKVMPCDTAEDLYDIEVKDNHNFVVSSGNDRGIVVHNCHHLGAMSSYTLVQAMKNAYWRYGFSATAYGFRSDKRDFYIKAAVGDVIAKATTTALVNSGHLVPTDILAVPFSHHGNRYPRSSYINYYKEAVITNDKRNKLITELAYAMYKRGKNILIAVQSIEHGKRLAAYLGYLIGADNIKFLYGEDDNAFRKETLNNFKNKQLPILISTLISEGVDIPHLETIIAARGEKSKIATIQLMGRSMRRYPGKVKATYIDIADNGSTWLTKHTKVRQEIFNSEKVFTKYTINYNNLKQELDKYYA